MINILYKMISSLRYKKIKAKKDYAKGKNIYVSGYPISGNSWIAYLITYILNCKYFDIDAIKWSEQRLSIKKYLIGENNHDSTQLYKNVYKTHERTDLLPSKIDDLIICVARDVRDVSNSYFHRIEKVYNLSNQNTSISRNFAYYFFKKIIPFRYRYKFITRFFAFEWSKHIEPVLKNDNIVIVSYEDMIDNPIDTLRIIINKIDPNSWNKDIAVEAIDLFSFEKMKKDAEKSSSNIIKTDRVGSYGDWKNYFSTKDSIFFNKKYLPIMNAMHKSKLKANN